MSGLAGGQAVMAKVNKSVLLPEALHDLCKDREDRTGTTFTRQVIAAMLEFFFSDSDGPQQPWIQLLMAVERGEIPIDKVPIEYCEWQVEYYRKLEEHAKEEDFTDQIGYARYMRKAAEQDLACWRQREAEHGSTIKGFIEDRAWLQANRTEAQNSDS